MTPAELDPLLKLSPAQLATHLVRIGDNPARQAWIDSVFDVMDATPGDGRDAIVRLAYQLNDIALELKRGNRPEAIRVSRYAGIYSLDYTDAQLIQMARESTGSIWWQHRTERDLDLNAALQRAYDSLIERGDDLHGHCRQAYLALMQAEEATLYELAEERRERESADMGKPEPVADDGEHYATTVHLTCAADIKPEPIRWLWDGYLAAGKLVLLAGPAGVSKTTVSLLLAAILTRAGLWPDGSRAPLGDVLIWSGEDDPADTLVPRLLAAGADLKRIQFITSTVEEGSERRPFDPATDMPALCRAMEAGQFKLLIVDPIVSAVSGDSHKNTEVRRNLQPLVDLAQATGVCVLGITHFSKGTQGRDPLERVTGSIAFGALARVVIACSKDGSEDAGEYDRLFVRSKSNIGPDGGGWRYAVEQVAVPGHIGLYASRCTWGDPLEGSARELLARAETATDPEDADALSMATDFLRDLLADGPVPAKIVKADGDAAGHAWRTLHRAADRLGVERHKEGMRGGWVWKLAPKMPSNMPEDARNAELGTLASSQSLASSQTDSGEVEL